MTEDEYRLAIIEKLDAILAAIASEPKAQADQWNDFVHGLSVRSRCALDRLEIESFEQLAKADPSDIMMAKNFGWLSLVEMAYEAARYGCRMKKFKP